ncbi:Retinaldehyde-binding protein 1 [Halotydeus destructor]|nr:Retinaldehyde-binding protein 1 [Halotydeus destructor]
MADKLSPVVNLREKIRLNQDLNQVKFDDKFLLKFLRARHHNVDATVDLLNGYVSVKASHPQLFVPPSKVRDVFEDDICCVLPKKNSTGSTLVLVKPGNWNPAKYDVQHVISASVSLYEQAALDSQTQLRGFEGVIDMRNTTTKQLLSVSLDSIKLAAELTEKVLPIKFEKIHIVHQSLATEVVFTMAKPFLSQDMRSRIVFHGSDVDKLHSYVDKKALPRDLGGHLNNYHARDYYVHKLRRSEETLKKIWSFHHLPPK